MFERFWNLFPKRENRAAALRAWEALAPDDALIQAILASVERQRQSDAWKREDGRFIPQPARWLAEHRWEDETPAVAQPVEESVEARIAKQRADVLETRRLQEEAAIGCPLLLGSSKEDRG